MRCDNPLAARNMVHQYRGVADTALCRRQTPFAGKRLRNAHGLPCAAAVRTAADTDVYGLLQVGTLVAADIIDPEQRPPFG